MILLQLLTIVKVVQPFTRRLRVHETKWTSHGNVSAHIYYICYQSTYCRSIQCNTCRSSYMCTCSLFHRRWRRDMMPRSCKHRPQTPHILVSLRIIMVSSNRPSYCIGAAQRNIVLLPVIRLTALHLPSLISSFQCFAIFIVMKGKHAIPNYEFEPRPFTRRPKRSMECITCCTITVTRHVRFVICVHLSTLYRSLMLSFNIKNNNSLII